MSRSLNFPVKGNHNKIDKDSCYEAIGWIDWVNGDAVFCWQVLPRLLRGDCEAHVSIQRTQEDQGNPASFVWL